MKTIINKLWKYFFLTTIILISCNDDEFLEREPIDFLAPDNIKTVSDLEGTVNGIYKAFISNLEEPIFTDFFTDNGLQFFYTEIWNGSFNSESDFVEEKWLRDYKMVLRANTVLDNVDNIDLSTDEYNQYKGEAIFMRALAYFDLIEFFGAVPLRNTVESLYE